MPASSMETILKYSKKLDKIISGDRSEGDAMDILKALKSTPVTLEVLQKTRIGMTVNDLRKRSQNKDLQTEAKNLIKVWKKLLDAKGKCAELKEKTVFPRSDSFASNMSDSNSMDSADTVDHWTESNQQGGLMMRPDSSQQMTNNKNIAKPKPSSSLDDFRTKSQELIYESLTLCDLPEDSLDANSVATEIEQSIFDLFGSTNDKYKAALRSRVFNLRDKRNPELRENVLLGVLSADRLASMNADEMASQAMKDLRKTFTKQAINEQQTATDSGTPTNMFKCDKCGRKNCSYNQMQTRSEYEPMTTFVFCRECGHRWKFC